MGGGFRGKFLWFRDAIFPWRHLGVVGGAVKMPMLLCNRGPPPRPHSQGLGLQTGQPRDITRLVDLQRCRDLTVLSVAALT